MLPRISDCVAVSHVESHNFPTNRRSFAESVGSIALSWNLTANASFRLLKIAIDSLDLPIS